MIRTDRKTGEPILGPRLTAGQLHAMANDPGWHPWMRLVAEHPHAWPALVDWWHTARERGFDAAGAAPDPPESMRGRGRAAMPVAPLPPETDTDPDPAPSTAGETSGDCAQGAPQDADGDFAALGQVADPEPTAMGPPPMSGTQSAGAAESGRTGRASATAAIGPSDLDDVKVRRVFPVGKALVALVVAAGLMVLSWTGLQAKNRHDAAMGRQAHESAASACGSAEAQRKAVRSDLDKATAEAAALLEDTGRGQVKDPGTLDALDRLLDVSTPSVKGSCAPDATTSDVDKATAALRRTTKDLRKRLADLKAASKAVSASRLDKTVDDANTLLKDSAGKVQDVTTLDALRQAIETRDADAIAEAVAAVNESRAMKEKADADQAAAAAQDIPQRQDLPHPGGGRSRPPGAAPPGWPVPAPLGGDTGLPGTDPGL